MFWIVDWSASPVRKELVSPKALSWEGAAEDGTGVEGATAGVGAAGAGAGAGAAAAAGTGAGAGVDSGALDGAVAVGFG